MALPRDRRTVFGRSNMSRRVSIIRCRAASGRDHSFRSTRFRANAGAAAAALLATFSISGCDRPRERSNENTSACRGGKAGAPSVSGSRRSPRKPREARSQCVSAPAERRRTILPLCRGEVEQKIGVAAFTGELKLYVVKDLSEACEMGMLPNQASHGPLDAFQCLVHRISNWIGAGDERPRLFQAPTQQPSEEKRWVT